MPYGIVSLSHSQVSLQIQPGKPLEWVTILVDVTARKHAEQELTEREAELRQNHCNSKK